MTIPYPVSASPPKHPHPHSYLSRENEPEKKRKRLGQNSPDRHKLRTPPIGHRSPTETAQGHFDPDTGVEDRPGDASAQIDGAVRKVEVSDMLRSGAVEVGLEVTGVDAAAVVDAVEEGGGFLVVGPALVQNAVAAEFAIFGVLPGVDGGVSVVRVVVDVADFGVALGVWLRDGGCGREGGAGQGGRVGVEDDLVVGADPAVVPLDDAGGLFPRGLVLPALVGVDGGDDVAPVVVGAVVHDGAVVVPAEGAATARGGTVGFVDSRCVRGAGIFAAAE